MWSWSVIQPKAVYNWVQNPSFEAGSQNWTLSLATVAATQSYRGSSGLYLASGNAPSAGAAATQTVAVTNAENASYASCYVYLTAAEGSNNVGLKVVTGGGTYYAYASNALLNQWQRVSVSVPSLGVTYTSATVTAYCNHTSAGNIWWDAFQLEDGNSLSTYFDGDTAGCVWIGRPKYSASFRPIDCRTGGIVVPLSNYMLLQSMQGWGRAIVAPVTLPFGLQGGTIFQRAVKQERTGTIIGTIVGGANGMDDLHNAQAALGRLLGAELTKPQALTRLVYDSGYANGIELNADVVYEGGLEFNSLSGLTLTSVPIRVLQPDPSMVENLERSAAIGGTSAAAVSILYKPAGGRGGTPGAFQPVPGSLFSAGYGFVNALCWVQPSSGGPQLWISGNGVGTVGGAATNGVVTLAMTATPPTVAATNLGPGGLGGFILAMQQTGVGGDYVYIGGSFSAGCYDYAGTSHPTYLYLVREQLSNTTLTWPISTVNGKVNCLAYSPWTFGYGLGGMTDVLYVGGSFSTPNVGLFEIDNPNGASPTASVVPWGSVSAGSFVPGLLPNSITNVAAMSVASGTLYLLGWANSTAAYILQGLSGAATPSLSAPSATVSGTISGFTPDTNINYELNRMAITPDGSTMFVPDYVAACCYIVNLSTNVISGTLSSGTYARGAAAVTPDGTKVYVASSYSNAGPYLWTLPGYTYQSGTTQINGSLWDVAITPDGSKSYWADSSGKVWPYTTATNTPGTAITTTGNPHTICITPDGTKAYTGNGLSNNVSVIAIPGNTLTTTITGFSNPMGVCATKDSAYVYVTNYGNNTVNVITTASNTVTKTIAVGTQPRGCALTRDGNYVYVANYTGGAAGTVSVISTATQSVVATVAVGGGPDSIVVSPLTGQVYVFNAADGTISIIGSPKSSTNWNTIGTITGTSVSATGSDLYYSDGAVYFSNFSSAGTLNPGGVTLPALARWTGGGWTQVAAGSVQSMAFDGSGRVHMAGGLTGGARIPGNTSSTLAGYGVFDGSAVHTELAAAATVADTQVAASPSDGTVVLLGDSTPANMTYVTPATVSYQGTAPAPCRFVLTASGAAYVGGIRNERTGQGIYFTNLYLSAGETLTVDTTPGAAAVTSDVRGNMASFVGSMSNLADFVLVEGENFISVLTSAALAAANVTWFNRHFGIDGAGSNPGTASYIAT